MSWLLLALALGPAPESEAAYPGGRNGQLVVATSQEAYSVTLDGRVTTGPGSENWEHVAYAGDGRKLLFVERKFVKVGDNEYSINILEGGKVRTILRAALRSAPYATIDRSGRFVFFAREPQRSAIELWDDKSRTSRTFLGVDKFPAGCCRPHLKFDPLARFLVFEGTRGLTRYSLGRSDWKPVTSTTTAAHSDPDFSPDGQRLVFIDRTPDPDSVSAVDWDGGNLRQLASGESAGRPVWSPDGRLIAYVERARTPEGAGGTMLRIMERDGSNNRALAFFQNTAVSDMDWQPLAPDLTPPRVSKVRVRGCGPKGACKVTYVARERPANAEVTVRRCRALRRRSRPAQIGLVKFRSRCVGARTVGAVEQRSTPKIGLNQITEELRRLVARLFRGGKRRPPLEFVVGVADSANNWRGVARYRR